jgi:hypothetical protein
MYMYKHLCALSGCFDTGDDVTHVAAFQWADEELPSDFLSDPALVEGRCHVTMSFRLFLLFGHMRLDISWVLLVL